MEKIARILEDLFMDITFAKDREFTRLCAVRLTYGVRVERGGS